MVDERRQLVDDLLAQHLRQSIGNVNDSDDKPLPSTSLVPAASLVGTAGSSASSSVVFPPPEHCDLGQENQDQNKKKTKRGRKGGKRHGDRQRQLQSEGSLQPAGARVGNSASGGALHDEAPATQRSAHESNRFRYRDIFLRATGGVSRYIRNSRLFGQTAADNNALEGQEIGAQDIDLEFGSFSLSAAFGDPANLGEALAAMVAPRPSSVQHPAEQLLDGTRRRGRRTSWAKQLLRSTVLVSIFIL